MQDHRVLWLQVAWRLTHLRPARSRALGARVPSAASPRRGRALGPRRGRAAAAIGARPRQRAGRQAPTETSVDDTLVARRRSAYAYDVYVHV